VSLDPNARGETHEVTEEVFRTMLDDRGILQPSLMVAPALATSYTVFAQSNLVRLDVPALRHHAAQFFRAQVGLTVEKRYDEQSPPSDAARIVLSSEDATASGTRLVYGRFVTPSDVDAADEAERAIGTYGLALLARRCPTLWSVVPNSANDRTALTLAAVLASTYLGPILSPGGREIIGVRSARLKLEGHHSPYR
jgi:hypothetical protein